MADNVVGLTGGIATGKSLVAGFFKELGIPNVDADQIARDIVLPGQDAYQEIVRAFGPSVLLDDGQLDRPKLANLVFSAPEKRALLNPITHPRIAERSKTQLAELLRLGPPYVIYNAALLIENKLHDQFDALVLIKASQAAQMQRLRARDRLSDEAMLARIRAQMPTEEKLAFADFVIDNEGDLEDTKQQVQKVHSNLVSRFSKGSVA